MSGNRALVVLATVAVVLLLYFGAPFFVPLLISLLVAYALAPIVGALTRVVRYRALAAGLVVSSIVALGVLAAWTWSDDVDAMWQKLPVAAKTISKSLQKMAQRPGNPVAEVSKAAAEVQAIGKPAAAAPPASAPPAPPNTWQVIWIGWKNVVTATTQITAVLFLVFFMLASGDLFKRKLLSLAGDRLSQRKDALRVIEEIDRQVRRYLAVLLISNVLVGLGVWAAFSVLKVQYAEMWGVAAAVLHTAPYFGPAIVAVASFLGAFLQFGDWQMAFLAAGSTVAIATVVGMVFATWLASRTTRMNATASFVGLLFFGWIWDFWGVLLAIPILAIVKTICDYNDDWKPVAELLGR
jgi:predicted PurR-regulated permease PerM